MGQSTGSFSGVPMWRAKKENRFCLSVIKKLQRALVLVVPTRSVRRGGGRKGGFLWDL